MSTGPDPAISDASATTAAATEARGPRARTASIGTLFLTVFLDLLGFGLVIPFLPGLARSLGASDFMATMPGAVFSLMQFLFIPIWGRLSDRIGRRPVLLWSIAASAVGMVFVGLSATLPLLLAARIFSGTATANIAVAQAYIADVTPPEKRAHGMGIIGMAFGLGFILGPAIGGELSRFPVLGRNGTLPCFVAAALSVVNLLLALRTLPESLPPEARGRSVRRAVPFDLDAVRTAARTPGIGAAVAVNFLFILWFAGMEQTFRLFTADGFGMSDASTGRIFAIVGITSALVQRGLVGRLAPRFGEPPLIRAGLFIQAVAFALLGASPWFGPWPKLALYGAAMLIAGGSGLVSPTLPAYASKHAGRESQGLTLGVLQSASALARALGPAIGGLFYGALAPSAPYYAGAVGFLIALALAFARLK